MVSRMSCDLALLDKASLDESEATPEGQTLSTWGSVKNTEVGRTAWVGGQRG